MGPAEQDDGGSLQHQNSQQHILEPRPLPLVADEGVDDSGGAPAWRQRPRHEQGEAVKMRRGRTGPGL